MSRVYGKLPLCVEEAAGSSPDVEHVGVAAKGWSRRSTTLPL